MPIRVVCPSCATNSQAPDNMGGRKMRCPKCMAGLIVSGPTEPARGGRPAEGAEDEPQEVRVKTKPGKLLDDDVPAAIPADEEPEPLPTKRQGPVAPTSDDERPIDDEEEERERRFRPERRREMQRELGGILTPVLRGVIAVILASQLTLAALATFRPAAV
jgi:hypothetical protein